MTSVTTTASARRSVFGETRSVGPIHRQAAQKRLLRRLMAPVRRGACPMAPTPPPVRERGAGWGTAGRPPAGIIDAMTKRLIRRLGPNHGQEDGDPDRAAQVILDVVDLDEPPLRLRLGS